MPALVRTAAALTLGFTATVGGEVIDVSGIEIIQLHHDYESKGGETLVADSVTFRVGPGEAFAPGFTASIGTGDTIVGRFDAPVGHKFVVTWHSTAPLQFLFADALWATVEGDVGANFTASAFTFEGFAGVPPSRTQSAGQVSDDGEFVNFDEEYRVRGDFEFTSLVLEFDVTHELVDKVREYELRGSFRRPSFGTSVMVKGEIADETLMTIEPITCVGDVDSSNEVDFNDILEVLTVWGPYDPCPPIRIEDIDRDCDVGFAEVLAVLANWGPCE